MTKPNRLRIHFVSGRYITIEPTDEGNSEAKIKELLQTGFNNCQWTVEGDNHIFNANQIERLEIVPPFDEKSAREQHIIYVMRRVASNLLACAWLVYIFIFPVENALIKSIYILLFSLAICPPSKESHE